MPNQNQPYYTLLTQIGAAEWTNAQVFGLHVPVTQLAVGDGGGNPVLPAESMQSLVNERFRVNISSISVDVNNPNWLVIEALLPANVGGWTIREIGLYGGLNPDNIAISDATPGNKLLAVGNFPETYKPLLVEGAAKDLSIRLILQVSNAEIVKLTVDPSVVVATRQNVDQAIQAHRQEANPHGDRYVQNAHLVDAEAHANIGTPEAIEDRLIRRDEQGRAKIATPVEAEEIANKGYVEARLAGVFASGTRMLFQQTAAPVGWTKDTTHDNKALRVVSGEAGAGGTNNFTSAFNSARALSGSVGATTLTLAQMPSHTHAFYGGNSVSGATTYYNAQYGGGGANYTYASSGSISASGSNGAHTHSLSASLNFDVQYVDVIIAVKD